MTNPTSSSPQSGVNTVHKPKPIGSIPAPRPGQVQPMPAPRPTRPAKSGFARKGKH